MQSTSHHASRSESGELVYIALGSNLGDRMQHLAFARERISAIPDVSLIGESRIEETDPLGDVPQGPYLNQMVVVRTTASPHALLKALQTIEREGGRERSVHWGPRTIDLDIVLCERSEVCESDLVVPHPAIATRDFWRRELSELGASGYTSTQSMENFSHPTIA